MRSLIPVLVGTALWGQAGRSSHSAASVKVQHLRCEYRVDPLGIDTTEPRLSWELAATNAKARNLRQSAYRVIAAAETKPMTAIVAPSATMKVAPRARPLSREADRIRVAFASGSLMVRVHPPAFEVPARRELELPPLNRTT